MVDLQAYFSQDMLVLVQCSLLRSIEAHKLGCSTLLEWLAHSVCGLLAWVSASSGVASLGSVLLPKFKNWILC